MSPLPGLATAVAQAIVSAAYYSWCGAYRSATQEASDGSLVTAHARARDSWLASDERQRWIHRYGEETVRLIENGPEVRDPFLPLEKL